MPQVPVCHVSLDLTAVYAASTISGNLLPVKGHERRNNKAFPLDSSALWVILPA
jgi:hypothetical protein